MELVLIDEASDRTLTAKIDEDGQVVIIIHDDQQAVSFGMGDRELFVLEGFLAGRRKIT